MSSPTVEACASPSLETARQVCTRSHDAVGGASASRLSPCGTCWESVALTGWQGARPEASKGTAHSKAPAAPPWCPPSGDGTPFGSGQDSGRRFLPGCGGLHAEGPGGAKAHLQLAIGADSDWHCPVPPWFPSRLPKSV